MADKQPS